MSTNTNEPSKQDLSSSQDNDENVTPNLQQQQQQAASIIIIEEKKSDPSAENDDNTPSNITQEQQQPQKDEKDQDEEEKKDSISKPMIDDNDNDNDNDDDYDDTKDDEKESKTKPVVGVQKMIFTEQKSSTKPVFDPQTHEPILSRDIPNKIIVARGKKLSFYYERARRILRLFDGMIITGFGPTVYIACSLVEVLKRNQMAVITHTETKFTSPMEFVNLDNDNYNNPGKKQYYQTSPPQAGIIFHLKVGKYGKYLSGYHQRKMMELFEKYDNLSGFVSVEDVKSMNLYKIFHANNDQIVSAEKFLSDSGNLRGPNNSFILPDFIKYCSLIVHPLIRDNMFKKILYTNFRIGNYYNLLNRNISDEDMGINDNIDMNDDNMNDDNVIDNVIDDNANDNNVNDEKMIDDGNMNEEDEDEDDEDDNNINLSIAKPNDDNKIDGNGNGNGNGDDDDEEQEEEESIRDEKEIDDERNIFDMDEVASPISPISPPGHTNHPSNKSNIQISSAHSNSMQQQVLQQQQEASQQQQEESTQQKEQEEEPVPQQPTNQINNTDKQND